VTPPTDEPLPKCIGRYRILGRLGAGGMGTVYKAHDPQLDRVVALKVQRSEMARHGLRFQREARAAAKIEHPHVCPIYDVGEQDGRPFVVMAYVEGTSLEQRLASAGRFADVGEAIALILQVLEGLQAVSQRAVQAKIQAKIVAIDEQILESTDPEKMLRLHGTRVLLENKPIRCSTRPF
jgi:serine/threonine protein kinase